MKPKKPSKKLSARARRKELTGINLAAMKKRLDALETDVQSFNAVLVYLKYMAQHFADKIKVVTKK